MARRMCVEMMDVSPGAPARVQTPKVVTSGTHQFSRDRRSRLGAESLPRPDAAHTSAVPSPRPTGSVGTPRSRPLTTARSSPSLGTRRHRVGLGATNRSRASSRPGTAATTTSGRSGTSRARSSLAGPAAARPGTSARSSRSVRSRAGSEVISPARPRTAASQSSNARRLLAHSRARAESPAEDRYRRREFVVVARDLPVAGRPIRHTKIGAAVSRTSNLAHYKDYKVLRDYRAQILQIRSKIQDFFGPRYKSSRMLFGALDLDRDGEISMEDWMDGIKQQRFPVSKHEAIRMFNAIDINHDNSLQYSEIVNIFEPATITSLAPDLSYHDAEMLKGFSGFTPEQLEEMGVDATQKRRKQHDVNNSRRTSNPNIDVYGRPGPRRRAKTPTRAQELELLREKMELRLCGRGAASGTKRINAVFQDMDTSKYGYLDVDQFTELLQQKGVGLNLQLNDREAALVLEQTSDGTGAFEGHMLAKFVGTNFVRPSNMHERGRQAEMEVLQRNLEQSAARKRRSQLPGTSTTKWDALLAEHESATAMLHPRHVPGRRPSALADPPSSPLVSQRSDASFVSSPFLVTARSVRSTSPGGGSMSRRDTQKQRVFEQASPNTLTAAASAMLCEATQAALPLVRPMIRPPVKQSPVLPAAGSAAFGTSRDRFMASSALAYGPGGGGAGGSAPAWSSRSGTSSIWGGDRDRMISIVEMDKTKKARRQAEGRRKFLQHHKRLQEYAVDRQLRTEAAQAARLRAKSNQQLSYLTRLDKRTDKRPILGGAEPEPASG